MARGPHITEEEKQIARQLKESGKSNREIARELQRSIATIYKMLKENAPAS